MLQWLAQIKLHSISSATEIEGIGVSGNCEKSQDREKTVSLTTSTAIFYSAEQKKHSTDKEKLIYNSLLSIQRVSMVSHLVSKGADNKAQF